MSCRHIRHLAWSCRHIRISASSAGAPQPAQGWASRTRLRRAGGQEEQVVLAKPPVSIGTELRYFHLAQEEQVVLAKPPVHDLLTWCGPEVVLRLLRLLRGWASWTPGHKFGMARVRYIRGCRVPLNGKGTLYSRMPSTLEWQGYAIFGILDTRTCLCGPRCGPEAPCGPGLPRAIHAGKNGVVVTHGAAPTGTITG
jgi:hypothetical protein